MPECGARPADDVPDRCKGIKWEQADEVCALAEKDGSAAGLRNATLIGVMSDAMLRVSEASAIDCEDIRLLDDGSGRLLVRRSKTDQAGHGCERYLGPPTVKRIKAWRDAGGIDEGPLFRPVHRSGSVLPKGTGCAVDPAHRAGLREGGRDRKGRVGPLAAGGFGAVPCRGERKPRGDAARGRVVVAVNACLLHAGAGGGSRRCGLPAIWRGSVGVTRRASRLQKSFELGLHPRFSSC